MTASFTHTAQCIGVPPQVFVNMTVFKWLWMSHDVPLVRPTFPVFREKKVELDWPWKTRSWVPEYRDPGFEPAGIRGTSLSRE